MASSTNMRYSVRKDTTKFGVWQSRHDAMVKLDGEMEEWIPQQRELDICSHCSVSESRHSGSRSQGAL